MDFEQMKRRELIRVAITEVIMTVAVICLTFAFVMVVSGYWINSDLEVKQNGFVQIYSTPRGATIQVDNDVWFNRTNASQMVSSGEREITLSRDGYDVWSKKINITEGVLYRLAYPRLFKQEREPVELLNISNQIVSMSYDKNAMLLMSDTNFSFVDLTRDKLEPKKIETNGIKLNSNQITSVTWSKNSDRILFHTASNEWILLSTRKSEYLNLTKEFGFSFSTIESMDDSYDELVIIENNNLRKINVGAKTSSLLATGVSKVWVYDDEIFYVASDESGQVRIYYVVSEKENIKIHDNRYDVELAFARFYDEKYLAILDGPSLEVYKGELPREAASELTSELVFGDENIGDGDLIMSLSGNFILVKDNLRITSLNMEEMKVTNYDLESSDYGWLDNYLIYVIQDGKMIVRDFDGENRREIISGGTNANYPAVITRDRYLYYFTENNLVREEIQ